MTWLLARLKEKSTWLALFTFASLFGMQIEPELKDKLIEAIIAVAAVVALVFKEQADEPQRTELPPIELQARPNAEALGRLDDSAPVVAGRGAVDAVAGVGHDAGADRVRRALQTPIQPTSHIPTHGFNDR